MEGAVGGNKIKIKALKIERDSLESEYKKEFSESQRERKKLHANFEAETFAREQLWKSVFMTHRVLFLHLLAFLIFYCCRNWRRLLQWRGSLRVFAF